MARQEAVLYVRNEQKDGFSDDEIKKALRAAGWPDDEIDSAFKEAGVLNVAVVPSVPKAPDFAYARKPEASPPLDLPIKIDRSSANLPDTKPPQQPLPQENLVENLLKSETKTVPDRKFLAKPILTPRRTKYIVAIAIGLFVVLSSAAAGYWYYQNVYPKKIRDAAISGVKDIKTYHYEAVLEVALKENAKELGQKIDPLLPQMAGLVLYAVGPKVAATDMPDTNKSTFRFKLSFSGDTDLSDPKNPKLDSFVSFDIPSEVGFISGKFELENRLVGGIYYFQFTNLPKLEDVSGTIPSIDTAPYLRKWVSLDPVKISSAYNKYLDKLAESDPAVLQFRQASSTAPTLTSDQTAKFEDLASSIALVRWDNKFFSENVRGVQAWRYRGVLDKSELKRFIIEIGKIMGNELSGLDQENFDKTISILSDPEINLWVSKDKREIIKFEGLASASNPGSSNSGVMELVATAYLSRINDTFSIAAPSGAYDFETVLDGAFKKVEEELQKSQIQARDTSRLTDLKNISSELESYFVKNGRYPASLDLIAKSFVFGIPKDTLTQKSYVYKTVSGGQGYSLSAKLEDPQNPNLKNDADPGDQWYDIKP